MTQWTEKRTLQEAREIRDKLSASEQSALTVRFMEETPPLSEVYVEKNCPGLIRKARRYNSERNRACCAEDIERLAKVRAEIEQEAGSVAS